MLEMLKLPPIFLVWLSLSEKFTFFTLDKRLELN
jgi:hypothetical protein